MVVSLSFTVLLVVVPAPRWAVAEELDVHTEDVRLARKGVDRSGDPLATVGLARAEVAERRSALAGRDRRGSGVREADVRALGVTLATPTDDPVLVRARVDGAWTPWLEVPFAEGEAPDRGEEVRPGVHSEPVWLGEADAYELDAPSTIGALEVHVVRPVGTIRTLEPSGVAGAATQPPIQSRASWGARPPTTTPTTSLDLKLAIVHHTVTGNTYSRSQVPAVLRSIQAYHQDARGYSDIAYNVLVDRFGVAWEGRAGGLRNVVLGGHSQGFNTGSFGVSVIGDYNTAGVSSTVLETIARVVAWKLALHHVDPSSTVPYTSAGSAKYPSGTTVTLPRIVGHRDVQATSCPGGNLYARLGALRTRVEALVPEYQAGLEPRLLDLDATGDGLTDPFELRSGSGPDVQWRSQGSGTFAKVATPVRGTYRPAVGDFDGDGRDDMLLYGTGSAPDTMWWSTSSGGHVAAPISVQGSYVPVVGDFTGNGVDEVLWYAPGLGPDSIWRWSGRQVGARTKVRQDLLSAVPLVGDLDGDGRDDVFFYAPGPNADDVIWWSNGTSFTVVSKPVSGWYRPVVHDANGDGRDDLTWYRPSGTSSSRWHFSPQRTVAALTLTHPAIDATPVAGDFDGDGLSDVFLFGPGTSPDAVWWSTPTGISTQAYSAVGTFAIVAGPMDGVPLPVGSPDDLLFVRNGSDWVWRGGITRAFGVAQVG